MTSDTGQGSSQETKAAVGSQKAVCAEEVSLQSTRTLYGRTYKRTGDNVGGPKSTSDHRSRATDQPTLVGQAALGRIGKAKCQKMQLKAWFRRP